MTSLKLMVTGVNIVMGGLGMIASPACSDTGITSRCPNVAMVDFATVTAHQERDGAGRKGLLRKTYL